MYSYDLFNMSNFMVTITDSVSKSAEGPIGLFLKELLFLAGLKNLLLLDKYEFTTSPVTAEKRTS